MLHSFWAEYNHIYIIIWYKCWQRNHHNLKYSTLRLKVSYFWLFPEKNTAHMCRPMSYISYTDRQISKFKTWKKKKSYFGPTLRLSKRDGSERPQVSRKFGLSWSLILYNVKHTCQVINEKAERKKYIANAIVFWRIIIFLSIFWLPSVWVPNRIFTKVTIRFISIYLECDLSSKTSLKSGKLLTLLLAI